MGKWSSKPAGKESIYKEPIIAKIFQNLPIGVVLYDNNSDSVLYFNDFFRKNSLDEKAIFKILTKKIGNNLNNIEYDNIGSEISVKCRGRRISIGFSFYHIENGTYIFLLSKISSKTVFFNSKNENIFFDKLSELIAEVAHEIGNPLAGINMSLQVLLNNFTQWPEEKSVEYISRTILEIERLSGFLKSIREMSKETELEMKWVNLHNIVNKLFLQNSDLIRKQKIKIENSIEKDLDIYIDENALYQILLNLLNNSLHVLKPNQKIRLYIEDIDPLYIKFVFRNNGTPIASNIIDKIFSPFFTTKEDGEGIGLAISLKLMTRMGGTIMVETPEDTPGAKFTLYIRNKSKDSE